MGATGGTPHLSRRIGFRERPVVGEKLGFLTWGGSVPSGDLEDIRERPRPDASDFAVEIGPSVGLAADRDPEDATRLTGCFPGRIYDDVVW